MGIKAALSKVYAKQIVRGTKKWTKHPHGAQEHTFEMLLRKAAQTAFGKDHHFQDIHSFQDYREAVPVREYEELRPYFDRIKAGEENVCWPGRPIYLSKTSGTTSGAKYIPITKDSIAHHLNAARNALLSYINESGNAQFVDGKMIFLQGSPILEKESGIDVGRLSGIVAHHVPSYLQKNRMPSWEANCIEDWEEKLDAIIEETLKEDMRLISGIPSWVQMYFERILEKTGMANILEVFPNFSLFVYGGLNYDPYRAIFKELIGAEIPSIETFPASEGFIAYQDRQRGEGLLLNLDADIFYEFIPMTEFHNEKPSRLSLSEVKLGEQYALILNTNAGLFGYSIGDTVAFTSLKPYRLVVTGRIKHFISAFGEHVIGHEVESSMKAAIDSFSLSIREFHVAPEVKPKSGLPLHQWFVEFDQLPEDRAKIASFLDELMQKKNVYYRDLREGNILRELEIVPVEKGGFIEAMKKRGKLGGQNKIPRLSNNREFADLLN